MHELLAFWDISKEDSSTGTWNRIPGAITDHRFLRSNQTKGRVRLPNPMNFRKNSKRPLSPLPPDFRKIRLQFFMIDGKEVWWPDSIGIQKCLPQRVSCFDFSQFSLTKRLPVQHIQRRVCGERGGENQPILTSCPHLWKIGQVFYCPAKNYNKYISQR